MPDVPRYCAVIAAPEDAPLANVLSVAVQSAGVRPTRLFSAVENSPSDGISPEARAALDSCLFALIVVSEATETSPRTLELIKYAFSRKKTLLPYKIHAEPLSGGLKILLGSSHWLDVSSCRQPEDGIPELIRVAETHLNLAQNQQYIESRKKRRIMTIGAGALFLLLLIIVSAHCVISDLRERYYAPVCIDLGDGVKMEFVSIPAGTLNGKKISEFRLGKTEVTQAQYRAIIGSNPSNFRGDDSRPVEQVSWEDAMRFCAKLTAREHDAGTLPKDFIFTLPSAAQWEYACRAGTTTEFYTGDGRAALARAGWFNENSGNSTHPVAQKEPNAWGLYDMHGNVWEWCSESPEDAFGKDAADIFAANLAGMGFRDLHSYHLATLRTSAQNRRIFRGGPWAHNEKHARAQHWNYSFPATKANDLGFRVALVPKSTLSENALKNWKKFDESIPADLNAFDAETQRVTPPMARAKKRRAGMTDAEKTAADQYLIQAFEKRDISCAETALKAGANPDLKIPYASYVRILETCAWNGLQDFVELLLRYGATPFLPSENLRDAMCTLFINGPTPAQKKDSAAAIAELLCDYGFPANGLNRWSETFIRDSVHWKAPEIGAVLMSYGANPEKFGNGINSESAKSAAEKQQQQKVWEPIFLTPKTKSPTYGNGKYQMTPERAESLPKTAVPARFIALAESYPLSDSDKRKLESSPNLRWLRDALKKAKNDPNAQFHYDEETTIGHFSFRDGNLLHLLAVSQTADLTDSMRRSLAAQLLAAGTNLEAPVHLGYTPFVAACFFNSEFALFLANEAGADPTRWSSGIRTWFLPRAVAAHWGTPDLLKKILDEENGSRRLDESVYHGAKLIQIAASEGLHGNVKLLLSRGADVNARDNQGATALHSILTGRQLSKKRGSYPLWNPKLQNPTITVTALADAGANLNARSGLSEPNERGIGKTNPCAPDIPQDGRTALHIAAAGGDVEMVKLLLRLGADPKITNARGETPRQFMRNSSWTQASFQEKTEIEKILSAAEKKSRR